MGASKVQARAKKFRKKGIRLPAVETLGWGGISHVTHTLYSRLRPSSGLEQALPGPQEGPGVEIPRGKPHRCAGFGLPCGDGRREVGPLRVEYLTGIHRF